MFLEELGTKRIKIPSGEITNYPYLIKAASFNKPIILSTGMSSMSEIEAALDTLEMGGSKRDQITVLHCTSSYPAPMRDINLSAMLTIKNHLNVKVGYSDHSAGIEIPIAAVAMGAQIIEKHFTLDRKLPGPDHKASLEPNELRDMIKSIRNIEIAIGSEEKKITESERDNILVVRKSIVATTRILQGETFSELNITTKRPGTGMNPMNWRDVIGKEAKRDFDPEEFIEL
jgi:N,N'-diacetyllegionaminate synthase